MKRFHKGLLVTSGICGGLGIVLLICGMLLGGARHLPDALSVNSRDFQSMKSEVMREIGDHTHFNLVDWFVDLVDEVF